MKTNQHLKTRCTVAVLSSLCCFTWFGSPAFGQSLQSASKTSATSKTQLQADTKFQPASPTAPIARNPLSKLEQADPSSLLEATADKTVVAAMANYSNRQNRDTEFDRYSWQAANLHHRRLFFEDGAIEREAKHRRAGNLVAGLQFFKSLVQFPMRLVTGK